jgi:hypothetical protein
VAYGNRYGYHRDELYFRAAARHPAFGYDDQGPITPLLGWVSEALFGESPRGLRVFSAVAVACVVVLVALVARELGAGAGGQLIAAAGTAAAAFVLAVGHLLTTSTFDMLVWIVILLVVARILGGGDARLWLVAGLAAGLGLENKQLPLLLVGSLAIGFAVDRRFAALRSPWLWSEWINARRAGSRRVWQNSRVYVKGLIRVLRGDGLAPRDPVGAPLVDRCRRRSTRDWERQFAPHAPVGSRISCLNPRVRDGGQILHPPFLLACSRRLSRWSVCWPHEPSSRTRARSWSKRLTSMLIALRCAGHALPTPHRCAREDAIRRVSWPSSCAVGRLRLRSATSDRVVDAAPANRGD